MWNICGSTVNLSSASFATAFVSSLWSINIWNVNILTPESHILGAQHTWSILMYPPVRPVDEPKQPKRQRKKHYGNWLPSQTTHVVGFSSCVEISGSSKFQVSWISVERFYKRNVNCLTFYFGWLPTALPYKPWHPVFSCIYSSFLATAKLIGIILIHRID